METMRSIKETCAKLDIEENFCNPWTLINNKYIELSKQYERAGISIYGKKLEDYGPLKLNTVLPNILGEGMFFDLIKLKREADQRILERKEEVDKAHDEPKSPIKKW